MGYPTIYPHTASRTSIPPGDSFDDLVLEVDPQTSKGSRGTLIAEKHGNRCAIAPTH